MIITPLDKEWARAETKKLIRQGKLKPKPCEICSAPNAKVYHLDYNNPRRVVWLCVDHHKGARKPQPADERLSALQRRLLRYGLMAHYRAPLDLACGLEEPGCFGLKGLMTDFEDRRERASRRSAAGLSIARLTRRGLLERCARGSWRLTLSGFKVARRLNPQSKPPTKQELARNIALRKAIQSWEDGASHAVRQAPQTHQGAPPCSNRYRGFRPGIEVKLDLRGLNHAEGAARSSSATNVDLLHRIRPTGD